MTNDIHVVLVAPDGTHSLITADGPMRVRVATVNWDQGDMSLLDEAAGLFDPVPFRSEEELRVQLSLVGGSGHERAGEVISHLTTAATFVEATP